eukprot:m.229847 g.229847  ORF g.229847 m.229847 type:complete len:76 (+) comp13888_c0_seq1:2013-2240(+)
MMAVYYIFVCLQETVLGNSKMKRNDVKLDDNPLVKKLMDLPTELLQTKWLDQHLLRLYADDPAKIEEDFNTMPVI